MGEKVDDKDESGVESIDSYRVIVTAIDTFVVSNVR